MAKVPGDTKIPMGVKAPVPGAVRRTLSGLTASSRLIHTKLKLPSLKPKLVHQDSNKLKRLPSLKNQKNINTLIKSDDEKDNSAYSDEKMPPIKIPIIEADKKDLTFSMCNKQICNEANRTFDINEKELKFKVADESEKTFVIEKELNLEKDLQENVQKKYDDVPIKITENHIGFRVNAILNDSNKGATSPVTGVLKYVGRVQTDDDLWCGIETDHPCKSYHNGCLNGVKYFNCKENHGLLLPSNQIKIQTTQAYVENPKLLELRNKMQNVRSKTALTQNNLMKTNAIDITHQLIDDRSGDNQGEFGPFSLLVGLDPAHMISKNDSKIEEGNKKIIDTNENTFRIPFQLSSSTPKLHENANYLSPLVPQHECAERLSDVNIRLIDAESMIDMKSINFENTRIDSNIISTNLSDSNVPLISAESLLEFQSINMDSTIGEVERRSIILNKQSKCDISASNFKTPPNFACLMSSTPEVNIMDKCNSNESEVKSTEMQHSPKQFILGPLTRKQNSTECFPSNSVNERDCVMKSSNILTASENRIKSSSVVVQDLPSPTVSEHSVHQISKQNSFDESLGILTPEHMDSISFLDNVRSPSADDFNDLMDSSKTTEKTVSSSSQTPSTENIKSLTPDVLKSLLTLNSSIDIKKNIEDKENRNMEDNFPENLDDTLVNANAENPLLDEKNEDIKSYNSKDQLDLFVKHEIATPDEENPLLLDFEDTEVNTQNQNDEYENFIQVPFKQSTVENLSYSDVGSATVTQNIDDELLPSVHSSILDPLSSVVDTTVNLDLPLDSRRYDSMHPSTVGRMDQTPSPEELPLDPVGITTDLSAISVNPFCNSIIQEQSQADSEIKTDTTKSVTSKVSNSFITSITSITSLDGYQGDGEMSRPVSRGADQSPTIGHRGVNNLQNHWQNIPINRRPDPMTDSDFFTESDADGHDEQVHRGDRRAQVIDGALYGSGKASNPPVLVSRNNNSNNDDSCMESSGVFTDMETHRCSPLLLNVIDDLSPEGSTPSTRSELSQKNNSGVFYESFNGSFNETIVAVHLISPNKSGDMDGNKDLNPNNLKQAKNIPTGSNLQKNEENSSNDKMNKEERNMALKKYKMPRRDVASKVKTMMSTKPNDDENNEKRPSPKIPKKGGRWDAVMNKISAGKSEAKPKSYLKDVKSKVTSRVDGARKSFEDASGHTSPKIRTPPAKLKSRRVRSRLPEVASLAGASGRSSPHSSQSDVSCGPPPPKHTSTRSSKKRDGRPQSPPPAPAPVPPPTAPARTHPPPAKQTNGPIVKKAGAASPLSVPRPSPNGAPAVQRKSAPRRAATTLSPRQSPPANNKDHPRPPSPRPPPPAVVSVPAPLPPPPQQLTPPPTTTKGVEALAVLVHYLVFQLDALNAPRWRAQAVGARTQLSEAAARLQRALSAQEADHHAVTESLNRISELESELLSKEAKYNASILSFTSEAETKYRAALEDSAALSTEIKNLKATLEGLRKEVAESRAAVARCEKEGKAREKQRIMLEHELQRLKQENQQLKNSHPGSKEAVLSAEVESLKSVLELKLSELGEERRRGEQLRQATASLPAALQRAQAAQSLADYLRAQLQRKLTDEANLIQQNKQLHESFVQMAAQKNRLSLHNEQLQYKLKHNTEVATLLAQSSFSEPGETYELERLNSTFPETFVRGSARTTASFNEKYLRSSSHEDRSGEWMSPRRYTRAESIGEKSDGSRCLDNFLDENSPPNSPKIKGVVEKNDSVSWIVEIEEPPEETVSRIVRRAHSFRNSTSPQSTRENLKRQRSRPKGTPPSPSHPLSQSASASSLDSSSQGGAHCKLFRSSSIEQKQYIAQSSTPHKINTRRQSERSRLSESLPNTRPRASSLSHDGRTPVKSREHRERSVSLNKEQNIDLEKVLPTDMYDGESLNSNGELALLQDCEAVPKESAGEALISGASSEDDSSLDERSHSPSDSESVSESDKYLELNGAGERLADPVLQKIAETMGHSLSTTPMEVSWSEDGECLISETDI